MRTLSILWYTCLIKLTQITRKDSVFLLKTLNIHTLNEQLIIYFSLIFIKNSTKVNYYILNLINSFILNSRFGEDEIHHNFGVAIKKKTFFIC